MSTGRWIRRDGPVPRNVLRSLRAAYAAANKQASALVASYRNNRLALIDIQGEIERGADRANAVALRAQDKASSA